MLVDWAYQMKFIFWAAGWLWSFVVTKLLGEEFCARVRPRGEFYPPTVLLGTVFESRNFRLYVRFVHFYPVLYEPGPISYVVCGYKPLNRSKLAQLVSFLGTLGGLNFSCTTLVVGSSVYAPGPKLWGAIKVRKLGENNETYWRILWVLILARG